MKLVKIITRTRKNSLVWFLQESLKILQESLVMIMTRTCKNSLVSFLQESLNILQEISQDYDKNT